MAASRSYVMHSAKKYTVTAQQCQTGPTIHIHRSRNSKTSITHRQACCCRRCRRWRRDAAASRYVVYRGTCWRRWSCRSAGDGRGWRRRKTDPSMSVITTQQVSACNSSVSLLMTTFPVAFVLVTTRWHCSTSDGIKTLQKFGPQWQN